MAPIPEECRAKFRSLSDHRTTEDERSIHMSENPMLAPFATHCIELRNRANELASTLRNALSDPEIRANAIVEADEAFQERRLRSLPSWRRNFPRGLPLR